MSNADTRAFTTEEICSWFQVPTWSFDGFLPEPMAGTSGGARDHIPGDTTTPPAPGAVWIGSGDA